MVQELLENDATLGGGTKSKNAVGEFYVRVLTALRENLEAKARRKEKKGEALSAVFLLNNYHYIVKTVQSCGIKKSVGAICAADHALQQSWLTRVWQSM